MLVDSEGKTMCEQLRARRWDMKRENAVLPTAVSFPWYPVWVGRGMSGASPEEAGTTSPLGSWGKLGKEVVHRSPGRANGKR